LEWRKLSVLANSQPLLPVCGNGRNAVTIPGGRILYIDDDTDAREIVATFFSKEGFDVVCAADPTQAIDLARGGVFDLYLVDSWMPGLSGVELTERLRACDKNAALSAGAQGYVVKPAAPADLIAEIVRLIAKSSIAETVEEVAPDENA